MRRPALAKADSSYAECPYPHKREGVIAERHVVRTYGRLMDLRTDPETGNVYPSPYSCEGYGKIVDVKANTGKEAQEELLKRTLKPVDAADSGSGTSSGAEEAERTGVPKPKPAIGSFKSAKQHRDEAANGESKAETGPIKGFTSYGTYSYFRTKHARQPYHANQRFTHPEFPGPFTGNQDIGWNYDKARDMNGGDRGRALENGNWFPINSSKMTKFHDNLSQMGIKLHKK